MLEIPALKRTLARVRRALAGVPAVEVETESPREAYLQTLLSRGDRRMGDVLMRLHERPDAWWSTLGALRREPGDLPQPDDTVHRRWDAGEVLPWDFIDHHIDKRYLVAERRKALSEVQTPPCDTHTCQSCGAC
jgi:hypothetical protein